MSRTLQGLHSLLIAVLATSFLFKRYLLFPFSDLQRSSYCLYLISNTLCHRAWRRIFRTELWGGLLSLEMHDSRGPTYVRLIFFVGHTWSLLDSWVDIFPGHVAYTCNREVLAACLL